MASDAVSNSRDGSEFVTVYSFGEKEEEGRKEKGERRRQTKRGRKRTEMLVVKLLIN